MPTSEAAEAGFGVGRAELRDNNNLRQASFEVLIFFDFSTTKASYTSHIYLLG
jgi:hypothetical protein